MEAGAIFAAQPFAMLVVSPLSGWLADRVAARRLTSLGLVVVVFSLLFLATIDAETSVAGLVLRLFVVGTGLAIFITPNMASVMGAVESERLGTASASLDVGRTIGNAVGFAVATALFASQAGSALGTGGGATEGVIDGIRLALLVGAASVTAAIVPSVLRGR